MPPAKDWLRVARAPLAPTAACDALACAWLARGPGLSRGAPPLDVPAALLLAATSLLVYVAGMAGNDLADRERDRSLHPERPLPSGHLSARAVAAFVALAAAAATLLGGGPAGSRGAVLVALGFAALYDGAAKRWTVPGALAMGGVRAANALVGVLPLLLAGTTDPLAVAAPLLVGVYSAGTTVLSRGEESRSAEVVGRRVARIVAVLAFGGAGVLAWLGSEGPTFGAFLAFGVVTSAAFGRVPRKGPVKGQVFEMLLGLFYLEAVLASGAERGSAWWWSLPAFAVAVGLILVAQLGARALRR